MQKVELKNILVSVGIAVFAGVLLFGVNAAFGVAAPSVNPNDATLVGPTFSDVTVNDDLTVSGNINVGTTLADPNDGTVSIDAGVVASGNINGANLTSRGDVDVRGNLWDSIDGRVNVFSNLDVLSGQDANSDGAGPLRIGSNPATRLLLDNNEILSIGTPLYLNRDSGQNVQIGRSSTSTSLTVHGSVIADGPVTAERFGTYYQLPGHPAVSVPAGATRSVTRSCPTRGQVVSCAYLTGRDVNIYSLGLFGNGCNAWGFNDGSSASNLYVQPICQYSDL